MGHKDIPNVLSDPALQTSEVQRGLGASFLPRWQTVSCGPEPETAKSECLTKFLFPSVSCPVHKIQICFYLLNVGDADAVCEHTEFCLGVQWPRRMWKQETGDPF